MQFKATLIKLICVANLIVLLLIDLAAFSGNLYCVQTLVNCGAKIDARDNTGASPIHKAAFCHNEEVVLYLLKKVSSALFDDNFVKTIFHFFDFKGNYPIHYAAESGKDGNILALIQHGSNVNSLNNEGWTPLHKA